MKNQLNLSYRQVLPFIVGAVLSWQAQAQNAEGGNTGGGGDTAEVRVNEIRADILKWIDGGGAEGLILPSFASLEVYEQKMRALLSPQKVVVGFTTNDQEVSVGGSLKTCRGFFSEDDHVLQPHILCSANKFSAISEAEQYRLIHHEYAGLAGLEKNIGAASDYLISNQITEFLVPEVKLMLSIKNNRVHSSKPEETIFRKYQLVSVMGGDVACSREMVIRYVAGQAIWFQEYEKSIYTNLDLNEIAWQRIGSESVGWKTVARDYLETKSTINLSIDFENYTDAGTSGFSRIFAKDVLTSKGTIVLNLNRNTGLLNYSFRIRELGMNGTNKVLSRVCVMKSVR